jgi:hypothetical protein
MNHSDFKNPVDDTNLAAEYTSLKAANDQLRELGKQWLWSVMDTLCSEVSRELSAQNKAPLQVGRQEWRFQVENSTMVGERFGARFREKTLTVELGWPREPQHGFVPDRGLARARIGLSQNVMLEARALAEMIFKRRGEDDPAWYFISNKTLGDLVTESRLRDYLNLILNN